MGLTADATQTSNLVSKNDGNTGQSEPWEGESQEENVRQSFPSGKQESLRRQVPGAVRGLLYQSSPTGCPILLS